MCGYNTEVPNPSVAAFIGFAAQAMLVQFVSAGASALHALLFGLNPGDATGEARDRRLLGRGVLITPPFV